MPALRRPGRGMKPPRTHVDHRRQVRTSAALATWRGATVLSTTRRADRLASLQEHGVDYPLLDTGEVAPAVRELYPDGIDAALHLVGAMAWNRCRRPTTTWSTTAPPASSSSASGINAPAKTGRAASPAASRDP